MRRTLLLAAGALASLVSLQACDSADPVAPVGTVLSISASPTQITATGTSEIRVIAVKGNGTPVNPGTTINFNTTLGEIPPSVGTDDRGTAIALLRGTGLKGMATVTASTGSTEAVTVDVTIGFQATSISLQPRPSSVPETGGDVELRAIVRNEQGQALPGAQVNFRADIGTLDSGGALVETDLNGEAMDFLSVTSADVEAVAGDTFQVEAEVGGGSGNVVSSQATLSILRLPRADFTFGTDNLTVVFTDTSTGRPSSWLWDFGDGANSREQNPTHAYAAADTYVVTLRATNSLGSGTVSKFVSVSGQ